MIRLIGCLGLLVLVSTPVWAGAGADLILTNGRVYTADPKARWAEAVAVKGDKIIYVGSSSGARSKSARGTRVIDLNGRLLLPGFIDPHNHVDGRAMLMSWVYLGSQFTPHTLEDYRQKILEFRASHPDAKQLRGTGFDGWILPAIGQSRKRQPRQLLDDIVSDIPVYIESWTGHMGWANTKALELAGVTKDSPDPPGEGAKFDRDPMTGEPNGMLQEAAMNFVVDKLPERDLSVEQYRAGILSFERDVAAPSGITGVLVPTSAPAENFDTALQQLSDEGRLTIHYSAAQYVDDVQNVKQVSEVVAGRKRFHGGRYLRFNTIKIMAPWPQEALNRTIAALDKEHFQVYVHNVGSRESYAAVLDAFEYALAQNGPRDSRHIITHNRAQSAALAERFKALNVRADADWHHTPNWYLAPKAFFAAGVPTTLSSDYPYPLRDPSPLATIAECAKHGLSLEALIDSVTIRAAQAQFFEKETGSIAVGKTADLIVLDKDLFKITADEIDADKVLLTLSAGKERYRDASL
jgi:predicted amidohydrolase YtcJ